MPEFALLALFLGMKHSLDADHLIAVSNLLSRSRSLLNSARLSVSWAAGHMLTAALITAILFASKDSFLPLILYRMELIVALMLIFIGILGIYQSRIFHAHLHSHGGKPHEHWHIHLPQADADHAHKHMFGIGIIQGLASNDELLLLLTAGLGLSSLLEMVFGVAVFSAGVAIGMLMFSLLFTLPIVRAQSARLSQAVNFAAGCVSVIYGAMMLLPIFSL